MHRNKKGWLAFTIKIFQIKLFISTGRKLKFLIGYKKEEISANYSFKALCKDNKQSLWYGHYGVVKKILVWFLILACWLAVGFFYDICCLHLNFMLQQNLIQTHKIFYLTKNLWFLVSVNHNTCTANQHKKVTQRITYTWRGVDGGVHGLLSSEKDPCIVEWRFLTALSRLIVELLMLCLNDWNEREIWNELLWFFEGRWKIELKKIDKWLERAERNERWEELHVNFNLFDQMKKSTNRRYGKENELFFGELF